MQLRGKPEHAGQAAPTAFHVKQLDLLCSLVRRWNDTIQLVSPQDCANLETRHVANCLVLTPLVAQLRPASVIDIGSGAGFPGLVVAVTTGVHVHLVEADRRKAEFLREAVRQLQVSASVHAMNSRMLKMTGDVVTARAVAPLPALWDMARHLLNLGGRGLFLKGAAATDELGRSSGSGLLWSERAGTVVEMRR